MRPLSFQNAGRLRAPAKLAFEGVGDWAASCNRAPAQPASAMIRLVCRWNEERK